MTKKVPLTKAQIRQMIKNDTLPAHFRELYEEARRFVSANETELLRAIKKKRVL